MVFRDYLESRNCKFIKYELISKKKIRDIDIIFHCASYASPKIYSDKFNEIYDANIKLTLDLINTLKISNKSEFIYISSSEVYGNFKNEELDENSFGHIDPLTTR